MIAVELSTLDSLCGKIPMSYTMRRIKRFHTGSFMFIVILLFILLAWNAFHHIRNIKTPSMWGF
jgi:hypothetical protein